MTRLELKTALTWEAKLENDTTSIAKLNDIIADAMIFIGQSHTELTLIEWIEYNIAAENPTPFIECLGIDRVELSGAPELIEPVTIPEEGKIVGPAPVPGWPKCYSIEGNASLDDTTPKGLSIQLIGGGSVTGGTDVFTVFYKKIPKITDDANVIPDSWMPFLKKECLARIALRRSKDELDNAKGYIAGGQQAIQVEIGTDTHSESATN